MKQHIAKQQYDELSDKAKRKLLDWWKPQLGDIVFNGQHKPDGIDALTISNASTLRNWKTEKLQINIDPLLTIGQMIEFLYTEFKGDYRGNAFQMDCYGENKSWRLGIAEYDDLNSLFSYIENPIEKIELCDALWQAVKTILEQ